MDESEPLNPENEKVMEDQLEQFTNASRELAKAFEAQKLLDDVNAGFFWDSLSYEDKCNAFHAVVSRIYEAEIKDKGSYRYALYNVFGFGPESFWGNLELLYDDGVKGTSNSWQCKRIEQ